MKTDKEALGIVDGMKGADCFFAVAATLGILFGLLLMFNREVTVGIILIGFGLVLAGLSTIIKGVAAGLRLLASRDDTP